MVVGGTVVVIPGAVVEVGPLVIPAVVAAVDCIVVEEATKSYHTRFSINQSNNIM